MWDRWRYREQFLFNCEDSGSRAVTKLWRMWRNEGRMLSSLTVYTDSYSQIASANKLRPCWCAVRPSQNWPFASANTRTHITYTHTRCPAARYIQLSYKHWAMVGPEENKSSVKSKNINTCFIFCFVRPSAIFSDHVNTTNKNSHIECLISHMRKKKWARL